MVGLSAFDVYAEVPQVAEDLRRGLAGEEFSAEVIVGDRVFETRHFPLTDESGDISGLLGVSMDVTERHRAEADRHRMQQQLLQAQKLESVGLLAGGIAHDFNNFLTAILGGTSTALLLMKAGHPARRHLDNVVRASRQAAELTQQMLAYSGKGPLEIKPLDVSAVVREITSLLQTMVPKKVVLHLELADELPSVEAGVAQVRQVLMNLVINGAEAIGGEVGTVRVTAGVKELASSEALDLVATESLPAGSYVYIEVEDTGCGMDQETLAKIFDPFFSTKFTGRGLGLAAVLGIVRAAKGAIGVSSTPGEGTNFRVFLPASQAVPPREEARSVDFAGDGLVLVVDDDSFARNVARQMCVHFGFQVVEADDGVEGVKLLSERPDEIVLVLLDMTMPALNGEETFRQMHRLAPRIPVILMSGYNESDATQEFPTEQLAGFLHKPFTAQDLAACLCAIFEAVTPE